MDLEILYLLRLKAVLPMLDSHRDDSKQVLLREKWLAENEDHVVDPLLQRVAKTSITIDPIVNSDSCPEDVNDVQDTIEVTMPTENETETTNKDPEVSQPKTNKLAKTKASCELWAKVVIFKAGFYMFDIVSDMVNGADYLTGDPLPVLGNNKTACDGALEYSHPIWGGLTLGFTWLPGIIYFISLGLLDYSEGTLTLKRALGYALMATVWPIFTFIR